MSEPRTDFEEMEADQRDQARADRARRLEAFVGGRPVPDVWRLDLLPILEALHASFLKRVLDKETDAVEGMRAIQAFVNLIGGQIDLGKRSLSRLAQRRLERSKDAGG